MSSLKITRDTGYADRFRKYKVISNAKAIGTLGDGESIEMTLTPGEYEVYLKIDWCRSNKIKFTVSQNETVEIFGGSNLGGWKIWFALVYILVLPHEYLWLKKKDS